MFEVEGRQISMIEKDFGEILPIRLKNITVLDTDIIKFIIYDNDETIFFNESFSVTDNILKFQLTREQSEKLVKGQYNYAIKQYRGDELLCTLQIDNGFYVKKRVKEE